MLSTPPAFILSQDQTLLFNLFLSQCWPFLFPITLVRLSLSRFSSSFDLGLFFLINCSVLKDHLLLLLTAPLGDSLISISFLLAFVNRFFKLFYFILLTVSVSARNILLYLEPFVNTFFIYFSLFFNIYFNK